MALDGSSEGDMGRIGTVGGSVALMRHLQLTCSEGGRGCRDDGSWRDRCAGRAAA